MELFRRERLRCRKIPGVFNAQPARKRGLLLSCITGRVQRYPHTQGSNAFP